MAKVMAAWVVNFARFSEWPQEVHPKPDSPIIVGIVGTDEVGESLANVAASVTIGERAVVIKKMTFSVPAESTPEERAEARKKFVAEMRGCHLLYVSKSEKEQVDVLLGEVAGAKLLTVSAIQGFAAWGGMFGFDIHNSRVTFDANPDAINSGGVQVSSKILRLARIQKTEKK